MKRGFVPLLLWILLVSLPLLPQVITRELIPMRDGVSLATDIYKPWPGTGSYPAILVRTPYGIDGLYTLGASLTVEGYAFVAQDTRGHGMSGGTASIFMTAKQDGYDTVEWIAAQPWSDGKVGTFGGSALGITQYMMAGEAPPHLICSFSLVATPDLYDHLVYPGGCFREEDVTVWMEQNGELNNFVQIKEHYIRDDLWDSVDLDGFYGDVNVASIHVGGWYDLMSSGTIRAFQAFDNHSAASGNQMLIMGPWTHGGMGGVSQGELTYPSDSTFSWFPGLFTRWFAYHLKGEGSDPAEEGRVQLYMMGDPSMIGGSWNQWRTYDSFPRTNSYLDLFPDKEGSLNHTPSSESEKISVIFNPDTPVPTVGGSNLVIAAGPYNQSHLLARSDLLHFSGPVLDQPLEVLGRVSFTAYISTDVPDLDLAVRLVDIYPDGRWMLVTDGIQRARFRKGSHREIFLEDGVVTKLTIDLPETAYVFAPGHRTGIIVSGSNSPRFDVNPQTGEPVHGETHLNTASVTLFFSKRYPTALHLPVSELSGHRRPATLDEPGVTSDTSLSFRFRVKERL